MSIPYIPGWWDSIKGDVMPFAQKLDERLRPDKYANIRMQEAIQRNPMLAQQLADMDAAGRQGFLNAMGMTAQNPQAQAILNAPAGRQRQAEEMKINLFRKGAEADPEGVAARVAGGRTQNQRDAESLGLENARLENQGLGQRLELMPIEKELKQYTLNAVKRTEDIINSHLKATEGLEIDVGKVIQAMNRGIAPPAAIMTRIQNDPGLLAGFTYLSELDRFTRQSKFQMSLRGVGLQDDFLRGQISNMNQLSQQVTAAYRELTKLEGNPAASITNPEAVQAARDSYNTLRAIYEGMRESFGDVAKRYTGVEYPSLPEVTIPAATALDASKFRRSVQKVINMLKDGTQNLEGVMADPDFSRLPAEEQEAIKNFRNY